MTNKELQDKLKEYPDDMTVTLYDDETGFNYDIEEVEVEHAVTGPASPHKKEAVNVIVVR